MALQEPGGIAHRVARHLKDSRHGPASAASWRNRSRMAAISSVERGGRRFCVSSQAAISGSSGIRLASQAREDLAIEGRVRLPRLGGDDASIAYRLLVDERGAGKFRFAAHVVVAGHVLAGGEAGGGQHLCPMRSDPFPTGVKLTVR